MSISKYFVEDKYLKSVLNNYIVRDSQISISNSINEALEKEYNLVVEAPTGSGKTMSYLIPALYSDKRIIISTKTKQLMNQLLYRDIPNVQKVDFFHKTIRELKGRKNYFCPHRYFKHINSKPAFYIDAVDWYNNSINEGGVFYVPHGKFDNEVCNLMSADRYQCIGNKCNYYDECPFYIQKKEANEADIIVTNHYMLLSDIAMKSKNSYGSIFDFRDHIIFDEAHAIADIFSGYAGIEINIYSIFVMFFENKSSIEFSLLDDVYKTYANLASDIKEPKVFYEQYEDKIDNLIRKISHIVEVSDIEDMKEEFEKYLQMYNDFISNEDGIRIIEKNIQKNNIVLSLRYIPFNAGALFLEGLSNSNYSSVFISATLSSNGSFNYFFEETGLNSSSCMTYKVPNVFNFKAQGRLYIPENDYLNNKDKFYSDFISSASGSILVICNSVERMDFIERVLRQSKIKKSIYKQTEVNIGTLDFSSEDMVLIGSAGLREGIDISGGGFTAVILDHLPFEFYKDLILQKRGEQVEKRGGDAFKDFLLPRAVLYFKQAVGRLIRHESDFGVWIVLDDRILTKSYGKYFKDVIDNVEIIRNINEALEFIEGGNNG